MTNTTPLLLPDRRVGSSSKGGKLSSRIFFREPVSALVRSLKSEVKSLTHLVRQRRKLVAAPMLHWDFDNHIKNKHLHRKNKHCHHHYHYHHHHQMLQFMFDLKNVFI